MKLIFRSSNINKAYTINYQVQDVNTGSTVKNNIRNSHTIVVTPKISYIIDAKDFIHGVLPDGVASVSFSNSSSKIDYANQVNVNIILDGSFTAMGNNNIIFDIPISGVGKFPANNVELHVRTPEDYDINTTTVLGTGVVKSPSSIKDNILSTTYSLSGKKGLKILLLQKTFTAFDDYYFSTPPTCELKANQRSRYQIKTFNEYNSKKRLISRKISIYYTFPSENIDSKDYVTFSATAIKQFITKKDTGYLQSLPKTIYSFKTIGTAGENGGRVPVEVRGTPGTPFRVAIKNSAGQSYDKSVSAFVSGGSFVSGVIPNNGGPIGVYRTMIKVPSIYANNTDATANNYVDASLKASNEIKMNLVDEKKVKTSLISFDDKREGFKNKSSMSQSNIKQSPTTEIQIFPYYGYSETGTDQ